MPPLSCTAGHPSSRGHVLPAMLPLVSLLRDDMEAELLRLATPVRHMAAVQHQHLVQARSPTNDDGRRWPILATWQWLVPMCTEVNDFGVEPGNSSAASTLAEGASDLAHRGIMPCGLGNLLHCATQPPSLDTFEVPEVEDEQHGTFRDLPFASAEAEGSKDRLLKFTGAAADALRLLVLALRRIRAEYLQRVDLWAAAFRASLEPRAVAAVVPVPARPADPTSTWLASPAGQEVIKELRWSLPDRRAAISRLRMACRVQGYRPSDARILFLLSAEGVPLRTGSTDVLWDSGGLTWPLAKALLLHLCTCAPVGERPTPPIQCCSRCRGALFADIAAAAPLPCPWCRHTSEVHCRACAVSLHFRGQCAWNRGANTLFRPSTSTPTLLCPDCHWRWLCARSALPSAGSNPSSHLHVGPV